MKSKIYEGHGATPAIVTPETHNFVILFLSSEDLDSSFKIVVTLVV